MCDLAFFSFILGIHVFGVAMDAVFYLPMVTTFAFVLFSLGGLGYVN